MYKKITKNICIASACLLTLLILYLFPKTNEKLNTYVPKTIYSVSSISDVLYTIDNNNYVSRINISLKHDDAISKALEVIKYLTVGSEESEILPDGFSPVIPKGTKVIDYELKDKTFTINFSKEFLNYSSDMEDKIIESLIYSLTDLKNISSIIIKVENNILSTLPYSKEKLYYPLDRSYGINKYYDIYNLKDTSKTTIYYISKNDSLYYFVPVTKVSNDSSDKIEIIIKELTSNNTYDTNLMSYLNSTTTLKKYELLDKSLKLDFNNAILSSVTSDNMLEEVTYAINLSIKSNYDVESVSYTVDNKKIATFDLKDLE